MPLGDSLTKGFPIEGAYRNRLHTLLTNAGYDVDFVGTETDSTNPGLPDRDHQGLGGFRIDQIQSGLSTWLNAVEDPDVVLLMIGTNDFSANFDVASAGTRLSNLVADIATQRPFAKIIVASLPLRTDDTSLETQQLAFNSAIPAIVSNQVSLGRQVTFLDMHAVLNPANIAEGVHPSPAGYDKMADAWFPAINAVITPLGTSNPPAIAHAKAAVDLQHLAVTFSKPVADNAANPANFTISGGVSVVQALLDPLTKRTVTLTTSAQSPGVLYNLTVSGVRDRTPQQNLIAPGSTVAFSSLTLQNGGFEFAETSWTMSGNRVVYQSDGTYVASEGSAMLIMNAGQMPPNAVASQTFPTVPGQFYTLGFDVGILSINSGAQALGVEVNGAAQLLSRTENLAGNAMGNSVWSPRGYSFIADSTSTTLTLRDLSPSTDGRDLLLDNVRVLAAVMPPNTAPVALADSYSTTQGVALIVPAAGVLGNDTDAQSSPLTAALVTDPTNGVVVLNPSGGFTYAPNSGFNGSDSFTYQASDGSLVSNTATVSVTVAPPSLFVNGSFEAGETGWTMTGNRVIYASDGTYVAFDGSKTAIFNAGNSTPDAVISQTFNTTPGQTYQLSFHVGILAVSGVEQKLQFAVAGTGTLLTQTEILLGNSQGNTIWTAKTYSFTANSSNTSLTFADISPTTFGADLLLDNVSVTPVLANRAPIAAAESYSTAPGATLVVAPASGVLANDSDPDSDALTAVLAVGPANGSLTLYADGGFTYTPTSGYTGADSFTYQASDSSLVSNIVTVLLAVEIPPLVINGGFEAGETGWTMAGNRVVYPNDGTYVAYEGTRMTIFNAGNSAPNATVSQSIVTVPGSTYTLEFNIGILALNAAEQALQTSVTGATAPFVRTDTVTGNGLGDSVWSPRTYSFVASGTSATLTFTDVSTTTALVDLMLDNVRLAVEPGGSSNTAPVAMADSYSTNQGATLVIPAAGILSNDSDAESNLLSAVLLSDPVHGNLALNPNGSFSYTPTSGYSGEDSFTYRANDGSLDSNIVTVSLTVRPLISQLIINGSFESNYTGWTTSGNQAIDAFAATDGIRRVTFNGRDLTPNAILTQSFATVPGETYTLSFDMGVLSYVKKQQKLSLTVSGNTNLLTQTISITGAGTGSTEWTPRTFTFVADRATTNLSFRDRSSSTSGIDLLLDNVRVTGLPVVVNAAPVAVADSYSVNQNTILSVAADGVLANDVDPQSNVLTAVLDNLPSNGSVSLNANGSFSYTPAANHTGTDSFTYYANDGSLDSNIVTVNILINEVMPGILANPSFESDFNGWTISGNQSIGYYPATDGIKIVIFNGDNKTPNGVLSQTFATIPGHTYSLAFDTSLLAYTTDTMVLNVNATGSNTLLDQTISLSGQGNGLGQWIPQNFTFMADSTATTLSFQDQSAATVGIDILLDNIRVLPLAAPPAAMQAAVIPDTPTVLSSSLTLTNTPEAYVLSMIAPQAGNYVFQISDDLLIWQTVDEMPYAADELIRFYDSHDALGAKSSKTKRFYRIGLEQ